MRRLLIMLILASSTLITGCYARGGYAVSATYASPELAYVSPGVYVIADYNEPIFYTDNLYWRFYGGRWYRSSYYDRGWAYANPPTVLARIDRPYAYVRYRPSQTFRVERDRGGRPFVRDHRRRRF